MPALLLLCGCSFAAAAGKIVETVDFAPGAAPPPTAGQGCGHPPQDPHTARGSQPVVAPSIMDVVVIKLQNYEKWRLSSTVGIGVGGRERRVRGVVARGVVS